MIPASFNNAIEMLNLTKIADPRGSLTFVEGQRHVPFDIKRVYYLYDVPGGEERGGHAHYKLEQLIIAIAGSFDVVLDNGRERTSVTCNRPFQGLLMRSLIWRELTNFSSGSVCLVLASMEFQESDYIRDHDQFLNTVRSKTE